MRRLYPVMMTLCWLVLAAPVLQGAELIHHDLQVRLHPERQSLSVLDTVTIPDGMDPVFFLHKGLQPSSPTPGVKIIQGSQQQRAVPVESFSINRPAGLKTFVIQYTGKIDHPLKLFGKEHARGFKQTPGIISEEGVYLGGNAFWYPAFNVALLTFTLQATLPPGWDAVSQGSRIHHDRQAEGTVVQWGSAKPHEGIHIVAGVFTGYTRQADSVLAMVFLRSPDEDLADKYLDVTARYLAMYEDLIGPYPYDKFALVENFWETGYGMASFTLLGPRIIRFPFILHSSYPHEILHNWWGNSVFPDFDKGNWSEGLTAYLADHLIKEMHGEGVEHRRQTLQKYADYVLEEKDFPLSRFRSRHSSSSEAVGYGKSLMVFHMLRRMLGDESFRRGLQAFYKQYRFRWASFDDLRKSFEGVSEEKLDTFFDQWTTRPGAPRLHVGRARVSAEADGYVLTALIEQRQPESAYELQIPLAVTLAGVECAFQTVVTMDKKRLELKIPLPRRPLRLDVDPQFDLFRRLHRDETPAALTQALGSRSLLIVLPSAASPKHFDAYLGLARSLGKSGPDHVEVRVDDQIDNIASNRSVVLLGWENAFYGDMMGTLSSHDVTVHETHVRIGQTTIPKQGHAIVLTTRQLKNADASLTWIASDMPEAVPGLGRKLPHYHKYSYLGFQGEEPENIAKGRWAVSDSPMTVFVPGSDGTILPVDQGKLKPGNPLATLSRTDPLQGEAHVIEP
jgi:aminopeptidase N